MSKRFVWLLAMLIMMSTTVLPATAAAQEDDNVAVPSPALAGLPQPAYTNEVLGVQLVNTKGFILIEDQVLTRGTYGFSLNSEYGLVLRVDMLYDASPDLDKAATELVSRFPDINFAAPSEVTVDGAKGVMLVGVPGIDPGVYIYVVANGRLYQIIYAGEALDERGKALVDQLRFVQPVLTVESLGLNRAETNLFIPSPYDANLLPKESGVELRPGVAGADYQTSIALEAVPGCADWPTSQSMQTPIASTANGNGYSAAGPSYYNEAEHKYCNRTGGLNDYYALDFPLRTGDVVYAPFTGNVKWVGYTCGGWSTLGKIVIVEKLVGTTKYWSMG